MKFEYLFEMGNGYVLNFSNSSFQKFIYSLTKIDIENPKYAKKGSSKAKRLRSFWDIESDYNVGILMKEMLEYWKSLRNTCNIEISNNEKKIYDDCKQILNKLLEGTGNYIKKNDLLGMNDNNFSLEILGLDKEIIDIIQERIVEIKKNLSNDNPLSVIFLCGSILEGILCGIAITNKEKFLNSKICPKDKNGNIKKISQWSLCSLINVACDIGLLSQNVKEYSKSLKNFRNYIHPFKQLKVGFSPNNDTAILSWQALNVAINELIKNLN